MTPTLLTLIQILIIALVAYRIWRLIGRDDLTAPYRANRIYTHFLECPWCAGTWIAFGITALVWWLWGLENPWLTGVGSAVVVGGLGERL